MRGAEPLSAGQSVSIVRLTAPNVPRKLYYIGRYTLVKLPRTVAP